MALLFEHTLQRLKERKRVTTASLTQTRKTLNVGRMLNFNIYNLSLHNFRTRLQRI